MEKWIDTVCNVEEMISETINAVSLPNLFKGFHSDFLQMFCSSFHGKLKLRDYMEICCEKSKNYVTQSFLRLIADLEADGLPSTGEILHITAKIDVHDLFEILDKSEKHNDEEIIGFLFGMSFITINPDSVICPQWSRRRPIEKWYNKFINFAYEINPKIVTLFAKSNPKSCGLHTYHAKCALLYVRGWLTLLENDEQYEKMGDVSEPLMYALWNVAVKEIVTDRKTTFELDVLVKPAARTTHVEIEDQELSSDKIIDCDVLDISSNYVHPCESEKTDEIDSNEKTNILSPLPATTTMDEFVMPAFLTIEFDD